VNVHRRQCLAALAALAHGAHASKTMAQGASSSKDGASLRTLAVLEVELIDDQNNPLTKSAQVVRLDKALAQLRAELSDRALYRVVAVDAAQDVQQRLRSQQEYMHRCDDCAAQIGRAANASLVMTPWVQKVSELILNFNVQIFDVEADKVIFTKSVDMRGNDDESWSRAVRFLVRDMAEKRARNPKYGQ
jgi:Protein of unknown function (DUF2380)